MILQFLINGVIKGCLYGVCAVGFGLVYNTTRIFHIAYSSLYVLSAYLLYTCCISLHFSIPISFLIVGLLTTFASIGIEYIVYQPLVKKGSSLNVMLISSIGVMIVLINLISIVYGNETKVISTEIAKTFHFGNIVITFPQITQLGVSMAVIGFVIALFKYSSFGKKIRAMKDDSTLIEVFGINIFLYRIFIFGLSGFLIALVSNLVVIDIGFDPYIGMGMFLNTIVAFTIGGKGKFESGILGGLILGITQSLAVYYFEARWENAITFALLILFLLFRPQGVLGEKERQI